VSWRKHKKVKGRGTRAGETVQKQDTNEVGYIYSNSALTLNRIKAAYLSLIKEKKYNPTRPFRQVLGVSSGHQAAVNLPATRYRPESQPLEPGNGG